MIDLEYAVILMPFPGDIYAAVRLSPDGYPTIYINDKLAPEARKKALEHELRHLKREDFYNPAERLLCAGRASPSPAQLLAFAPGKQQAARVWEP